MKTRTFLLIILALTLAACGSTEPSANPDSLDTTAISTVMDTPATPEAPAPESAATRTATQTTLDTAYLDTAYLDTAYENALSGRNLLALGILRLEASANAVTPEQAQTMLPLWQLLLNSQKSGTGAEAEIDAVLQAIEESLAGEQIAAINAMQLTQTDMQDWASANGVALGSGGGQGQGKGMSDEARATRQAEEGRTPGSTGGGASTALVTAVIEYLSGLNP